MKNYLKHNLRRHYPSGRPRISVMKDQIQALKSPLKNIASCYPPGRYQMCSAAEEEPNEKEMKKCGWLDNFFWNHSPVSILKGDILERDYSPFKDSGRAFKFGNNLKKYFSACNLFEKSYLNFMKENYKSAENINPCNSIKCQDTVKQVKFTTNVNTLVPKVKKCSNHGPYLDSKRTRSQSNSYLRNNFLRPSSEISDNGSRSFTTLGTKSESTKTIIPKPSKISRNIQSSVENANLLADSGHLATKATERAYERLKKRDFDWMNSFSSEAVILQPSRGEFSIKKLINKTTCQERLWGLPPRQSYAKTLGPGMNDNLVQYTALKHKMQSDYKKHNFIGDRLETNLKVKKLIKSAKEKNKLVELKKKKNVSNKYSARNVLKTIKDSINLKPIDILKRKEKTAKDNEVRHLQKANKKRTILNFRMPNLKVMEKQQKLLQKDKPLNKPPITEYQSSASYKHVFQELFNQSNKTKVQPKSSLSFFNRQQVSKNVFRPANNLSAYNLVHKKKILKKRERSTPVPERNRTVNLKNQARTPFQKPSNTQLTSKSKASFSTVSKIPKMTRPIGIRYSTFFKNNINITPLTKEKMSERPLCTNERKEKEGNKPIIKKTLYSTLGYYPAIPNRIVMKPKKKTKSKKNNTAHPIKPETTKENRSHTQSVNSNNAYFSQRRSLSSMGIQIGNIMEMDKSIKTVTEPVNEEVFNEVMSLCKEEPTMTKEKTVPCSEKEKSLKRYGRCSLQERKKPERRRGFVCRIASMLKIGCGRRRRPNEGCRECGKKAG
ncbi:unnamed protein product [Nezara viridula]|uniref:Uncharacterized protein n=1 Tax=Nezara viridula TaxID=85310 RepID=A0A9P0HDZ0_NEZVI|nr:unnamed protein product [Nezara viridula]